MAYIIAEITYSEKDEPIMNARGRLKRFNKTVDQTTNIMSKPTFAKSKRAQRTVDKALNKAEPYAMDQMFKDKETAKKQTSFEAD